MAAVVSIVYNYNILARFLKILAYQCANSQPGMKHKKPWILKSVKCLVVCWTTKVRFPEEPELFCLPSLY
jgi:hypothetical protein